jgi:hypothetical protein
MPTAEDFMERKYLLIYIYIYIILGIPGRYPFGITGKYLKSRVGISKNTIDPCLCRH